MFKNTIENYSKVEEINKIPINELFTDTIENYSKVEEINKIPIDKLIENFEGGIQKSRLKFVFVIIVLLALWLIMF